MKLTVIALLGLMANVASGVKLTKDTFDYQTEGKMALIKFYSSTDCAACETIKPQWDKLMGEFDSSKTSVVGDVDCASEEGKALCQKYNVRGYPTIKWGNPNSELEDYSGLRDFDTLKTFVEENLKPLCSPMHPEHCDAATQKEIKKLMALSDSELDKKIAAEEAKIKTLEDKFKSYTEDLRKSIQDSKQAKEDKITKVKNSGYKWLFEIKGSRKRKSMSDEL